MFEGRKIGSVAKDVSALDDTIYFKTSEPDFLKSITPEMRADFESAVDTLKRDMSDFVGQIRRYRDGDDWLEDLKDQYSDTEESFRDVLNYLQEGTPQRTVFDQFYGQFETSYKRIFQVLSPQKEEKKMKGKGTVEAVPTPSESSTTRYSPKDRGGWRNRFQLRKKKTWDDRPSAGVA